MSARRLLVAVLSALVLVLSQAGSTAGADTAHDSSPAAGPDSGPGTKAAAPRTYVQNVDVPGYSVYCRWVPQLLVADGLRGEGCFDSAKDYIAVVDTKKDGRGVAVLWVLLGSDKRGICRNGTGSKKRSAWPTCHFESTLPETGKIRAWVSTCNVTETRNCRKWGHYKPQNKALKRVYKLKHPADA